MVALVQSMLVSQPDLGVVGSARDGLEAIERAEELHPDVVVMDIQMPKVDGLGATRRIKQSAPAIGIVLLSGSAQYESEALWAGADGYLSKPFEKWALIDAVKSAAASKGNDNNETKGLL